MGDQFLSAALDQDKTLLEFAMQQRVILATPTSFVGLLRAIAYGWNQEHLNKKLGKNLDASVGTFNKLIGSYESNVLPGAKKFTELGVETHKEVSQVEVIETPTRGLTKATTVTKKA